jgi:hypothetical protein
MGTIAGGAEEVRRLGGGRSVGAASRVDGEVLRQPRGDDRGVRTGRRQPAQLRPGVHQGLRALGRRVPAQGGVRHRAQLHPAHAAAPGKVPDCSPLCPSTLFVSICQYQCSLTLLTCVVSFLLMLISLSLEMKLIAKQFALKSACIYT